MGWRETLLNRFGPGLLSGVTIGTWLRVLQDNGFAVSPACWPRALTISLQSVPSTLLAKNDRRRFGRLIENVEVPPPIFLLGHWRHGTTHLHNLLAVDPRFAFPNNYQVLYPNSFLTAESLHSRALDFFLPRRRPMDNVEWKMQSPQEDEFALCVNSLKSPCLGWIFPQRRDYYDRYLTMREVSPDEISAWKNAFLLFLKKLTWHHQRPLLLKSPPHTARIKLLLEMFPGARFVHIRRNPYDVFQSTRKMLKAVFELHRLQRVPADDMDDWILKLYRIMYTAFFEEQKLIPSGQFHEIAFEELERDPVAQVRSVYDALRLPAFAQVQSLLQSYADSITNYQRNVFTPLPDTLRRRVASEWRQTFDAWGYAEQP